MKKIILLSSIAFITGGSAFFNRASAQITIDYTDLPSDNLQVVTEVDSTTSLLPQAPSSSSQFWDFSSLKRQKAANISFMLPGATAYGSAFSAANLADSTVGGNGYNFFDTSATSFSAEGAEEIVNASGTNFQVEINLSPLFVQSPLPATYGDIVPPSIASGSETFSVTISVVTQEKFTDTITYNDTVDAWGTMKMPNGYTYNVLRQKHNEIDYEDAYLYLLSTWTLYERIKTYKYEYNWYAKDVGYILAEMDMDSTSSTVKDVVWDTTAPVPTGINELSINNFVNIYPNPANSSLTFSTSQNFNQYIHIYDITGRLVDQVALNNRIYKLSTAGYANGVYLYKLTDNSGNLIDRGKFIVQH